MALVVKDLIDAGVHFGHRASRWNPKMKPYIYGKRNLIHIIDLKETVRGLLRATKFFNRIASANGLILFVGTKRQAAETIIEECNRCGMPYVTERWLGGTLTNFRTIRSRLERLEELETILDGEQALELLQEDDLDAHPRAAEDRAQPERHPAHDPASRGPAGRRPAPRAHRGGRGAEAGHQGRRPARHRLRPRPGRPADPGQRRQHAVDRAGGQAADRRDPRGQGRGPGRAAAVGRARAAAIATADVIAAATAGVGPDAAAAACASARQADAGVPRPSGSRRLAAAGSRPPTAARAEPEPPSPAPPRLRTVHRRTAARAVTSPARADAGRRIRRTVTTGGFEPGLREPAETRAAAPARSEAIAALAPLERSGIRHAGRSSPA